MRIFITGGSGFLGSIVVKNLVANGHEVVALSRSESSSEKLNSLGASKIIAGDLEEYDVLDESAKGVDAVIHCGFIHDFENFQHSCDVEYKVLSTIAERLEQEAIKDGKKKKFIFCSGLLRQNSDVCVDENTPMDTQFARFKGAGNLQNHHLGKNVDFYAINLPILHGPNDKGFLVFLGDIAQKNKFTFFVGEGKNVWWGAHVLDAAELFLKVLQSHADDASKGEFFTVNANQEVGIPTKIIAETIAQKLGLPTKSISPEDAAKFGFIGVAFGMGCKVKNEITRQKFNWEPKRIGLLEDIKENYFT